jgi:hypothetical protein
VIGFGEEAIVPELLGGLQALVDIGDQMVGIGQGVAQLLELFVDLEDFLGFVDGHVVSPLGGDLTLRAGLLLQADDGIGVGGEDDCRGQAEFPKRDLGPADDTFGPQATHVSRRHFPGLHALRHLRHNQGELADSSLARDKLGALALPDRQHQDPFGCPQHCRLDVRHGRVDPEGRLVAGNQERLQHVQLLVQQGAAQQAVPTQVAVRQKTIGPESQAPAARGEGRVGQ